MMLRTMGLSAATVALMLTGASVADARAKPRPRVDLAEAVQGTYSGDVISDAHGSSRSDVTVTITRTGPNMVAVDTDYGRIPRRTFKLTKVMSTIQNVGGTEVFLLDLAKPQRPLMLTIDDAAWSGERD